ncbi:MAG: UDP-N-acetylmuramoyl-tripeptide--D-alanyl-D-alanine ligase, partial [Candidatus Marinimicrobia bacterium]|nr:UDP-N-acetylmuramoyl-tripeptide--D-alanyl-D-alanine ligase [Candidatus Neomarinimicrobiota bacterium]
MNIQELLSAELIPADLPSNIEFTSVIIDSREAGPGTLFCPLKGENTDGHEYIEKAFKAGTVLSLIEKNYLKDHPELSKYPLIPCDDPLKCLQLLASNKAKQSATKIIALTGSVGKTSTRQLLFHLLKDNFEVYQSIKNYNNHIGYPLSILNIPKNIDYAILEMGANHRGEIAELCHIAAPDIALITRIARAHLEGFGSLKNIQKAKFELFDNAADNAELFINNDDPLIAAYSAKNKNKIRYGSRANSDIRFAAKNNGHSNIYIRAQKISLNTKNSAYIENIKSAASIAIHLGIPILEISDKIRNFKTPEGRGNEIYHQGITIINDAYNANPISLSNAIKYFSVKKCKGRKYFIFADMLELGDYTRTAHEKAGSELAQSSLFSLICYGELSKTTAESAKKSGLENSRHSMDKSEISKWLNDELENGDCVIFKGSRGAQLEDIIKELTTEKLTLA